MTKLPIVRVVLIFALILTAGCGKKTDLSTDASGAKLTKVRLQTDWFPQPEHGGYYQALAKGFYAEEGLDVEILPGGPNAQVMSSVALGRVEFGMTNGDDVIVSIARGVPVKMIGAEMQRDAQGILYHEENPINSLQDLEGKTIMAGSGSTWITVVNKKMGINFNLIPLVGDLARFMNSTSFVQQCFVTNEPFFARQRGAKVGALLIANDTYEPYRVMLTGSDYIKKNPEIVAKFVRASVRGWVDYLTGDPSAGNALLMAKRDDLTPEFLAYSIKAMNDYKIVLGDSARGEIPGQITAERINKQISLLQEVGVLDKKVDVNDVVAFEFVPQK
jgi:NitT/TauT family transport system substrate-binding protein